MLVLAAVPVLVSALLGLVAAPVSTRLPPAIAVRLLVPAALAAALATGFCLSVLAFNAITGLPLIARLGHWRLAADPDDGTPPPIGGVLLALIVVALLIAASHRLLRTVSAAVRTGSACRNLGPGTNQVVIVDDNVADAFAVPGLPVMPSLRSRIVLTTAMMQALDADERRVLIAHERSHLSHHHQLLVQLADLAAAANPLLIPVARQVRVLIERWADEDAAGTVGSRSLVARAVARAALARTSSARRARSGSLTEQNRTPLGATALGAATAGVPNRVLALSRPQPGPHVRFAGLLVALSLAGVAASGSLAYTTENKFEHAAHAGIRHAAGHVAPGGHDDEPR